MMQRKGIDVSSHQGDIDFRKVKDAGIEFVMLRAGYGWENPQEQTDSRFLSYYRLAVQAGLPCGAYHYSYARSAREADQEAEFFLKITAGLRFEYPVAYDVEDKTQMDLGREAVTEIAAAFCGSLEKAGYYPCLYTNPDWIRNRLDLEKLKGRDIWLAHYAPKPGYGDIGMWQYTGSGSVDGISTSVDLDIAYRDYPTLIRARGLNGFGGPAAKSFTVKPGDTMSAIARRAGVTLAALIRANPHIKNPNRIYPGDKLILSD